MNKAKILNAMRAGNIVKRSFTLYIGNGNVDKSRNTARGLADVAECAKIIGNHCYIQFAGGQMEQVLDDMVCVSYIPTPACVRFTINALRLLGVQGKIAVCAEYNEGDITEVFEA